MSIRNKINWILTWTGAFLLKKSLSGRLRQDGARWVQTAGSDTTTIYNRIDFILDHCKGRTILHIGFTDHPFTVEKIKDGSLLHIQLKKVADSLIGVDNVKDSVDAYTNATGDKQVFYTDILDQYPPEVVVQNPEIILLAEVLEHLTEPQKAVDTIYATFQDGTKLIVTVPNYAGLDSLAASLNKTESIHPDHHWYLSPYTLTRLFSRDHFEREELHFGMYYQPRAGINSFLKQYPYNGDCIIAVFKIKKNRINA